ncbi:putative ATP-dependent bile acid permease, partial [Operophtera brumata]
RSPVFSHLNATVLGLATVRSFGAECLLGAEFDRHQDLHSAAWYLFISCSRAFGYFLDSISLTGIFQWGMRQSAEMENQMTSVERVIEYTKLPNEPALRSSPDKKPPANWPPEGFIHFDDLSLKYTPDGNYVLHKLQLEVLPQEKIGIVGRTGAGKSSIIQALFRLAYLEGTISIDGIDVSTIGLHDLREKISIIPQLLRALQNVELQSEDEGTERQLVCLARAIVHNDRILVLDEATANVDAQTDALIQTAIRVHFEHLERLSIGNILQILVLDAGRLMEYDHPHILLQNKKGYFRRMVGETGTTMARGLHKLAAQNCSK